MPTAPERKTVALSKIRKRHDNPNKMTPRQFDLLVDNIKRMGLTDPLLLRPLDEPDGEIEYELVGGHHRYDACQFLQYTEAFATIITDPKFDQEEADFQLVRMNMIHGKLDPQAFFELYQKYANQYGDAVLQDAFGFSDEAEWKRLVNQLSKALPDKAAQDKFKEAAKEIKTIDGLSELLNKMFTLYGDTLPYGYMIIEYGGQKSFWLQATAKTIKNCETIGHMCIEQEVTLDDLMAEVLQHLITSEGGELVNKLLEKTPKVLLPKGLVGVPVKDKLKTMNEADDAA